MSFLITLYTSNEGLHSRLYRKETACNAILHAHSSHPTHQIDSIPYGEFVRVRRNCSEESDFLNCIGDMRNRFLKRGYPFPVINRAAERIAKTERKATLSNRSKPIESAHTVRLIIDYNNTSLATKRSIQKHWKILLADKTLKDVISARPQITYRRGRCLKNRLSPTVPFSDTKPTWLTERNKGFFKCGFCGVCKFAKHGTTSFTGHTKTLHKINRNINCTTRYVVYILECTCKSKYVGSTIRPLKERISEHVRAINQQDARYPMALHIGACPTQGPHKKLQFYGIEVTEANIRGGNRELRLRRQEALWIMRLQTVGHGQNCDHELQYFLGT